MGLQHAALKPGTLEAKKIKGTRQVTTNESPQAHEISELCDVTLLCWYHVQVVEAALANAELGVDAVDWLLLHQANQRILDSASQRLNVSSPS